MDKIGIYTLDGDSVPLEDVMRNIKQYAEDGGTVIGANSSSDELKDFFKEVLEDYDDERVYVSDIKKVIKWYTILAEYDLIQEKEEEESSEEEEATSSDEDSTDGEEENAETEKSEE